MTVREATIDDLAVCVRLTRAYLETFCIPVLEMIVSDIAAHIGDETKFFYVVESDGGVVGVFYGYLDTNVFTGQRFARERLIFIVPAARSAKLFSILVNKMQAWARQKRCELIRFQATGSSNNEALARLMVDQFGYRQIGFVVEKEL